MKCALVTAVSLLLLVGSSAIFLVPSVAADAAPKIAITDCIVASGGRLPGIGMHVEFVNQSTSVLTRIVWQAKYGDGWVRFTDAGTFTPGVKVSHDLWFGKNMRFRSPFQDYRVEGSQYCAAIETENADESVWRDVSASVNGNRIPDPPSNDGPTVPATYAGPDGDPIGVIGCRLSIGLDRKHSYGELSVRFRNLSLKPIDRIRFRGLYRSGGFDFTYGGFFSPGTLINSHPHAGVAGRLIRFDLPTTDSPVAYTSLDSPTNCVVVSAHFVDGTLWQNPTVGPTVAPSPGRG